MSSFQQIVLLFPLFLASFGILPGQLSHNKPEKILGNDLNASRSTIITSDHLDLVTTKKGTRFLFSGNATVQGTNLRVNCGELEVLSLRDANVSGSSSRVGRISFILAKGDVHIMQEGRVAIADNATIDVIAGIVTMKGSAMLEDDRGKVMGDVIIMERGKGRAEVRGSFENRPKVELPPLPDLRLGRNKKKTGKEKQQKQK